MSAKDLSQNKKTYFKRNYADVLEILTPNVYMDEDRSISGLELNPVSELINTHINVAANFSSILYVSSTTNQDLTTISGIAPYFIKQNNLTKVTPFIFERDVLCPLDRSFKEFETSGAFKTYLSSNLLPKIVCNNPDPSTIYNQASANHEYFLNSLSWFYILNRKATPYSPSSYVLDKFTKLYIGEDLDIIQGLQGLEEFLWRNLETSSAINNIHAIPSRYVSGTATYTSGTQQLEKLKTLIEIAYSTLHADAGDTRVQDAFEDYISSQILLTDLESRGPFWKLLKSFGFLMADVNNQVETLNILYDIERCPEEFLPYVADLIGWKLLGHDPERWRLQLRSAVAIYKAKGTKKSIQLAIDSIFTAAQLQVSGGIVELYESYIPNLIFYMLATESPLFQQNFKKWSGDIAKQYNVVGFSPDDMEYNIRCAVDTIMFNVVSAFPEYFYVGACKFDLDDPNFIFEYRDKVSKIPPWDEEKFYKDARVSVNIIKFIINQLEKFQVPHSYSKPFEDYIGLNTTYVSAAPVLDNRFLFFTSALELPPNYDTILYNPQKKRERFLSLWSGKSSHFSIDFLASSFDFNSKALGQTDGKAFIEAAKCIDLFAPAHAIPITKLTLDDEYDNLEFTVAFCPQVEIPDDDCFETSSVMAGYKVSGINLAPYHQKFKREDVSSIQLAGSGAVTTYPRNSVRRRSFINTLPKDGFYTRTGFNMPTTYDPSTVENSLPKIVGMIPLGYIPSAGIFQSIGNIRNIPAVYDKCMTLDASNVFYGYAASTTFPSRGLSAIEASTCHDYVTRDTLPPVVRVMHEVIESRAFNNASAQYLANFSAMNYACSDDWQNIPLSIANPSAGVTHFKDYENFGFGVGIHNIYKDYTKFFTKHKTSPNILDTPGGANIISHTYGPLIYNGCLDVNGSAVTTSAQLSASAATEPYFINHGEASGILSVSALNALNNNYLGTVAASTTEELYVDGYEYRNAHIVSGVELVIASGSSEDNGFYVYKIAPQATVIQGNNFPVDNTIVELRSFDGLPRMRFDLSAYGIFSGNYFIPDHDFELTIRAADINSTVAILGGAKLGFWLHTTPEHGLVWSFTPENKWQMHNFSDVSSSEYILNNLTHTHQFPIVPKGSFGSGILSITEDTMSDIKLEFNTRNKKISLPEKYFKHYHHLHRTDQRYILEVFKVPSNQNNSIFVDKVSIIDKTQEDWAKEYTAEQLITVFKFFNDLIVGKSSRNASLTGTSFETSGGSRINYREHPAWTPYVQQSDTLQYTYIEVID